MWEIRATLAVAVATFAVAACIGGAHGQSIALLPEPARVIYPGEQITAESLVDVPTASGETAANYTDRNQIIGKVSRLTLLPRRPIPLTALREPPLVVSGQITEAYYSDGQLLIVAKVMPLQDGHLGEQIRVRNIDSSKIISATVQPDGRVRLQAP
jgi:flagellar basal body P-ring formation protein FlgA